MDDQSASKFDSTTREAAFPTISISCEEELNDYATKLTIFKINQKPKGQGSEQEANDLGGEGVLTSALEDLPNEKTEHMLQIIRKRNVEMVQSGNGEVELDFELMDNETLWELAWFVSNCKKLMSKLKRRQGGVSDPSNIESVPPGHVLPLAQSPMAAKKSVDDEDVDICDAMPLTNYPSME